MSKLGINDRPANIWNVDETGVQDHVVPKRVVNEIGKPCHHITTGENGETKTVVACFNAFGKYMPPVVIFQGKRCQPEWMDGEPQNTILRMSDNGWITTNIFMNWGELFLSQLPKNDEIPHLLLLDDHGSRLYNLNFLRAMRAHTPRVEVWCFLPHSTHVLQPADVAVFRSLKHYWNEQGLAAARETGGRKLSKSEFFSIFTPAWHMLTTVENAQSGFRKTGICPFNSHILLDSVVSPSFTTEIYLEHGEARN